MSETEQRAQLGRLQAEISKLVIRLFAEYTGRGPGEARTVIRDNLVFCVTTDSMLKAEKRLVADGEKDMVRTIRRKFQDVMRDDLVAGIELLTERKVVAFMSDHDPLTDHAVEAFVLAP